MTSRSGRIHTANQPLTFSATFERSDILIVTVYKNSFVKHNRISDYFDILFRNHPLISGKHRFCFNKFFSIFDETGQFSILAVTFGYQCVSQQIKWDGLITFYAERICHSSISISFETPHKWCFSIPVFVILENSPSGRLQLYIFEQGQLFFDFIPLKLPGSVFIRIDIIQCILIVQ